MELTAKIPGHGEARGVRIIVRREAAKGKKGTVMRIRREAKGTRMRGRRRRRIARKIQRGGNGLYQAARWSTFRFSPAPPPPPPLSFSLPSSTAPLLILCRSLQLSSSLPDPSLIVFHSFLRPFHFVTVRVPGRPCETFAVPHGWAG